MRNLTITRTKSFVGCLGKMKVYVEDYQSSETVIGNVPCRKLGTLKNGETQTFPIGNEEVKIFVIADQISKNYCNEFYKVPAGENDVFLTGKNCYNPAAGNPFRFDGVTDEEVLKNRKKGTKKGIVILVAAILVGIVIGLATSLDLPRLFASGEPETFTYLNMSITLDDRFDKESDTDYNICFNGGEAAVFVLRESYSSLAELGKLSLDEYAEIVMKNAEIDASIVKKDGLTYCEYTLEDGDDSLYYVTVFYECEDAFWLFDFVTFTEEKDEYAQDFFEWAKSVKFE